MEGIIGSPPDLRDLPKGCAFNPRCRWAMQQCREERPRLQPIDGSSREVACWLHRGYAVVPPELARPEPAGRKPRHPDVTRVGRPSPAPPPQHRPAPRTEPRARDATSANTSGGSSAPCAPP